MASFPKPDSRPLENCDAGKPTTGARVRRRWSQVLQAEGRRATLRYYLRPDTTPEAEVETLQRVYQFVLECYEGRTSDEAGNGEVATEVGDAEELPPEPAAKGGGH